MKRPFLVIAASLLLSFVLASVAAATTYETPQSPAYGLTFGVKGHRIVKLRGYVLERCDNGSQGRLGYHYSDFNVRIDPDTGRFRWQWSVSYDQGFDDGGIVGTVYKRKIVGRLYGRSRNVPGEGYPPYNCWSGQTYDDPWVLHFVARRQ